MASSRRAGPSSLEWRNARTGLQRDCAKRSTRGSSCVDTMTVARTHGRSEISLLLGALPSLSSQQKSSRVPTKLAVRGMSQFPATKMGRWPLDRNIVAEYDVANDLSDLGPMLSRQTQYTLTKFSVQRKVAEANYLSFGTFSSELSKSATTTVSLVSDIAFVIVSLTECPDSDPE